MAETIKVIARCRPFLPEEKSPKIIEMGDGKCNLAKPGGKNYCYQFDSVFDLESTTEEIYSEVCHPRLEES